MHAIACMGFVPTPPPRKREIRYRLKQAVQHAQLLCPNFENTVECRIAWDTVDDLTRALHKPDRAPPETRPADELREYDV